MTDARQYVAVEFKPGGARYTYHWEGPALFKGDRVKVADGRGWKAVTVMAIIALKPPFDTKPIMGRVEDVPSPTPEPKGGELVDFRGRTRLEDDDDDDLFGGAH